MSSEFPISPEIRAEVINLTEGCLRNDIAPEELARLEELVRGNPSALQEYLNYVVQSACLARWADGAQTARERLAVSGLDIDEEYLQRLLSQPFQPALVETSPEATRRESSLSLRGLIQEFARQPLAVAILLLVMISGGVLIWQLATSLPTPVVQQTPPPGITAEVQPKNILPPSQRANRIVARLTRTSHATWQQAEQPANGAPLQANQKLLLKQGLAEIEFSTGAIVVLEGPAELELGTRSAERETRNVPTSNFQLSTSPNSCSLTLGKLYARVPEQAHGFTVHTPTMTVVDLGTEFAVEVGSRGSEVGMGNVKTPTSDLRPPTSTEVHVLRGEVSVQPAAHTLNQASPIPPTSDLRPPTLLKAGEAVVSEAGDAAPRAIKAEPSRFVRELPKEEVAAINPKRERGADEPGASVMGLQPGDILAVSRSALKLVKIDPKTGEQILLARGERGIHGTDWMCVAVDAQRRAVVGTDGPAESGSRVLRIDPRDGSISILASGGLLTTGRVTALAIAEDGMIFATLDGIEDKVLKIDPQTREVSEIASFGNNVWGIAMDVQGHDLMAVSDGAGAVAQISGKKVNLWVAGRDTEGARGVAVRPDGRVFVSIYSDPGRRIVEIDRHTHRVTDIATLPPQQDAILGLLAIEPSGNLIVGSYGGQGRVYRIDVLKGTATILSSDGHLEASGGVAVVPESH